MVVERDRCDDRRTVGDSTVYRVVFSSDIALLENNIGFFSKSKNADAMVADIKDKIAKAKRELQDTIEKVRLIDSHNAETAENQE